MHPQLKYGIFALAFLVLAYGCVKKKTYTSVPAIEFKSFVINGDAADLSITFTDGDGDIGHETDDNTYNLYMTYYYFDAVSGKFTAVYDQANNDTIRNPAIVRRPADYQPGKPISGEITENISAYRHSKTVKRLKYVVYIFDNAGHKSNVLTTPEIAAP
ncbi:MAG: hypothetical protein ACXVPD_00070 [Bacteroidia bacterium]